ncbi:hypothetical protein B0A52_06194 [Exophiala mesophila]|uniref:Uncharacterized protein n=1 Tax=Exophiala mesophila TaxID=212818 RepID=A0A438N2V8_EXOME|nr:hypothetical protein B0A52_06194 [Exophiala mesophila]
MSGVISNVDIPTLQIAAELRLHPNVHSINEEWSGITDPVLRRKLQNRLNQRAARKRKAESALATGGASTRSHASDPPLSGAREPSGTDLQVFRARDWVSTSDLLDKTNNSAFTSLRDRWRHHWFESADRTGPSVVFDAALGAGDNGVDCSWGYTLPADHLLTLVYYNVYRALVANIAVLGLDLNLMYTEDYPSPFTPMSPTATSFIRRLPACLQPTPLQKSIDHHPQWDLLPDHVIRDNLLLFPLEELDDDELCFDMLGGDMPEGRDDTAQGPSGFIVWGEPWDVNSWEVTEYFARKWPKLLKNAVDTLQSTNRWRLSRGEAALDFDRILDLD